MEQHKLVLQERNCLHMTGVTEVVSFDEQAVVLCTELGNLIIQGRELKLKQLAPEGGQITVEGTVCSLSYEEPRPDSWFRRLLG